uniref:Uncharacterized protein AlNc14C377G11183 n=1 Tax=Albugo laibachii Nc14 TaxID=890382 RepID=F0WYC4_9STRA|nr:conserved hypothetical protein [Albugo laibachii Nc14]|eukprot:CCA26476.1 conserved hypothetical protein [Albugo laibachii Nc14]
MADECPEEICHSSIAKCTPAKQENARTCTSCHTGDHTLEKSNYSLRINVFWGKKLQDLHFAPFAAGMLSHSKLSEKIKTLGFFPPDIEDKVLQYAEFCKFLQDNQKEHPLMPYILTKVGEIGQIIQSQKRHWDRWKIDEINLNLTELGTQLDILNGMQNSMVKHELQLATSQVQKQEWEQRYRITKSQLKKMEKELKDCMRKASTREEDIQNCKQLLQEKDNSILQAEKDNDALQLQCDTIEDAKIEAENGQVHLSEQLEKAQRELESAQRVIAELKNEREQWLASRKHDCEQWKMYQMEKETQNSKICNLSSQLEKLHELYKVEISRNKELMKRIEDMNTRQEELSLIKQQENTALRIHLQQLEKSLHREEENNRQSVEMLQEKCRRAEAETLEMREDADRIEQQFRKEREAFTSERDHQIQFWKEKWRVSEQKTQEIAQKHDSEVKSIVEANSKLSKELNMLRMRVEQSELERQKARETTKRLEALASTREQQLEQVQEILQREGLDKPELLITQTSEAVLNQKNLKSKNLQEEKEALAAQLHSMTCKVEELEKNARLDRFQENGHAKKNLASIPLNKANDMMNALATDLSDKLEKLQRENQNELERVNLMHHATIKSLYQRIDELEHSKRLLISKQAEMEEEITELQEAQADLVSNPHICKEAVGTASQTTSQLESRKTQMNGFSQLKEAQTDPIVEKNSRSTGNLPLEKRELELELGQTRHEMHLLMQKVIEYEKQQEIRQTQDISTQLKMSSSNLHQAKYEDLSNRYNQLLQAYDELQSKLNAPKEEKLYRQSIPESEMTPSNPSHRLNPENFPSEAQTPSDNVFLVEKLQFELETLSAEKKRIEYEAFLLNENVKTQTSAIDRLQQLLNEQRDACAKEIHSQLSSLREENTYLSELVVSWRNAYEEKASNHDAHFQLLDAKEREIDQIQASRKTLEHKLDQLHENKLKMLEELESCKTEATDLRQRSQDLMHTIKKQELSCQKLNDLTQILGEEARNAGVNVDALRSDWRSILTEMIQIYKERIEEITNTKHTMATWTNWKAKYLELKEIVTTLHQEKKHSGKANGYVEHDTFVGDDEEHIAHCDSDEVRLLNEHLTDLMKQNVRLQHRKEYYKTMSQSHKLKEAIQL